MKHFPDNGHVGWRAGVRAPPEWMSVWLSLIFIGWMVRFQK